MRGIQRITHYMYANYRQPGVMNGWIIAGLAFQCYTARKFSLAVEIRVDSRGD